jgi:hypothetical protein
MVAASHAYSDHQRHRELLRIIGGRPCSVRNDAGSAPVLNGGDLGREIAVGIVLLVAVITILWMLWDVIKGRK